MSEKPLAELSPRDIESQLNLKAGLTRGIPELAVEIRRRLEALEHSQKIVNIYFSPWGAAKAARWEELSNDGPFDAEGALCLIRAAIDAARAEGKHE